MVLPVRIELTTSPLPRGCSTTELRQLDHILQGLPCRQSAVAILYSVRLLEASKSTMMIGLRVRGVVVRPLNKHGAASVHWGWWLPTGQAELVKSPWLPPLSEQLMQRRNEGAPLNVQLPYLGEVDRLVLVR